MDDGDANEILAVLVSPRTERFYDYYLNGEDDRRTMRRDGIERFCEGLCPARAKEIRRCAIEMRPFVIYPRTGEFIELKENAPPKLSHRALLFPMDAERKRRELSQRHESARPPSTDAMARSFSVWRQLGAKIDADMDAARKGKGGARTPRV